MANQIFCIQLDGNAAIWYLEFLGHDEGLGILSHALTRGRIVTPKMSDSSVSRMYEDFRALRRRDLESQYKRHKRDWQEL